MSLGIVIRDDEGERSYGPADFPLSIGGARDAAVHLPGLQSQETLAFLGISDGRPFLQPNQQEIPVFCNEHMLEASRWLEGGDAIRIASFRINCEFARDRLVFRVHHGVPVQTDETQPLVVPPPPADDEIEPVPYLPGAATRAGGRGRPWRLPVLGGVALALSLLFVGYLLTAKAVRIEVEPGADHVRVVESVLPGFGGLYFLRPGRKTVIAEKEGFRPLEAEILVGDARDQLFSFQLERLPGLLSVSAGPVDGATVALNGEPVGDAPLSRFEIAPGQHLLRVSAEHYQPFSTELAIEGGGIEQFVEAELLPRFAEIAFASNPAGASLWVDGVESGTSAPGTAEILEGEHVVELRLEGYVPWRRGLSVVAGEAQTLDPVELERAGGTLSLDSRPAGASVAVDGTFRGTTPLELTLGHERTHEIQLSKLGHVTTTRSVRADAGETRELTVKLEAQRGELDLRIEPDDAELVIDGVPRGRGSQRVSLTVAAHTIEVRKEGYAPFTQRVTPLVGVSKALNVELVREDEVAIAGLARRITTGLSQELVLLNPGRITLGSSRRRPGRRANEVQRVVDLQRPFYIAAKEVTNREFREFQRSHRSSRFDRFSLDENDQPVVQVTWQDAARFCNWLSDRDSLPNFYVARGEDLVAVEKPNTGYRLPTEAEWAWAARSQPDGPPRRYPWGDAFPPPPVSENYLDASAPKSLRNRLEHDDGYPVSAPVGSFPANTFGIFDLGGNVAEWVHDHYAVERTEGQIAVDPLGPAKGGLHVIRGASWQHSSISKLRLAYRDYGAKKRLDLGFRIARYAR